MTKPLANPDLPAHTIITHHDDGSATRNDGVVLQAANANPWYVLATIYGEQPENATRYRHDEELAAKNRRAWNVVMCAELSDDDLADRAKRAGLDVADLILLPDKNEAEAELAEILAAFQKRMQHATNTTPKILPHPTENIVFSQVKFERFLNLEKFVFEKTCDFRAAQFHGASDFRAAQFHGYSYFRAAQFHGASDFRAAQFHGYSYFSDAQFHGDSYFSAAQFHGGSYFREAQFHGYSYFSDAQFHGDSDFSAAQFHGDSRFIEAQFHGYSDFSAALFYRGSDFSSATFKKQTDFSGVRFSTHVPLFHAAELYEDTVFPARERERGHWPPFKGRVTLDVQARIKGKGGKPIVPPEYKTVQRKVKVMDAFEQKRAYNRLRQFMSKSIQVDEELFFHRMEMHCKTQLARWYHKPMYLLFSWASDFGSSVIRPLAALLLVIAFGAAAPFVWPDDGELLKTLRDTAGWSLSNTMPFLGLTKLYYSGVAAGLEWPLRVIGAVQTVFGYVLLFLFGLGVRNRFRLR